MNQKIGTLVIACLLALSAAPLVPSASAHHCVASEPSENCDSSSCPANDTEPHNHTTYEPEKAHCESEPYEPGCYYLGHSWPMLVCDLLGYSDDHGAPGTPGIPQCGPDQRMAVEPGLVVCVIPQ